jgi:hypothetical protein
MVNSHRSTPSTKATGRRFGDGVCSVIGKQQLRLNA